MFCFSDTATTEIYTLSLHDALPISRDQAGHGGLARTRGADERHRLAGRDAEVEPVEHGDRSEEHTSELQSQSKLVCRLLLEKKKREAEVVDGVVCVRCHRHPTPFAS